MPKLTYLLRIIITLFLASLISPECRAGEEEDLAFAIGAYNDGFYEVAEPGFATFVKKYKHSKNRPYALYLLGVTRFARDKYDGSIKALNELTELYPKYERSALAHYYLGEASYITDDYDTARKSYQYVYDAIPEGVSEDTVLFRLGELNFVAGDYNGAKDVLAVLYKNYPQHEYMDTVRLYLAFSYYYTKWYKNALKEFKHVMTKPDLIRKVERDVLFFAGDSAFNLKEYDTAQKYFSQFLKATKNDKRVEPARYFLALSLYHANNKEGALKELKAYITAFPNGEYADNVTEQLANIYFEVKQYKKANEYLSKLIKEQSGSENLADWLLKSAWCYTNTKDYKSASSIYERLEKEFGDSAITKDVTFLRAEAYFMSKEYFKALKVYEKLKDEKKYKVEVLRKLGDCHFYLKDYYMSRDYYSKYIKKSGGRAPDDTLLKYAISLQNELPKDKQGEALKVYEQVVSHNKRDYYYKTALYNVILFYDANDDHKKLKVALKKYIDLNDDDTPAYFYLKLANAYFIDNETKNAIKYYDAARKTNIPDVMGESLFKLGKLYHRLNDLKKSLEYFNHAEGIFVQTPGAKETALIYAERASIYEKQKDYKKARAEYLNLTQISSDKDLVKIAKERISKIDKIKSTEK